MDKVGSIVGDGVGVGVTVGVGVEVGCDVAVATGVGVGVRVGVLVGVTVGVIEIVGVGVRDDESKILIIQYLPASPIRAWEVVVEFEAS